MAMTKKEREAHDIEVRLLNAEIERLKVMAALCLKERPKPDIPIPVNNSIHPELEQDALEKGLITVGYHFDGYRSYKAWSSSDRHGEVLRNGEFNAYGRRGGVALYSKMSDAMLAYRYKKAMDAAEELRAIDVKIEIEIQLENKCGES
jgi:hypothetical protein